jgi:hypothetical protein
MRSSKFQKGTHATVPTAYWRVVAIGPELGCFRLSVKNIPKPKLGKKYSKNTREILRLNIFSLNLLQC